MQDSIPSRIAPNHGATQHHHTSKESDALAKRLNTIGRLKFAIGSGSLTELLARCPDARQELRIACAEFRSSDEQSVRQALNRHKSAIRKLLTAARREAIQKATDTHKAAELKRVLAEEASRYSSVRPRPLRRRSFSKRSLAKTHASQRPRKRVGTTGRLLHWPVPT